MGQPTVGSDVIQSISERQDAGFVKQLKLQVKRVANETAQDTHTSCSNDKIKIDIATTRSLTADKEGLHDE